MRSPSGLRRTWSIQRKRYRSSAPSGAGMATRLKQQIGFRCVVRFGATVTSRGKPALMSERMNVQAADPANRVGRGQQAALRGFGWGVVAGVALIALMYLADLLLGLRPLPQLLNQPLLSLMPGFVFGFLIDTLQHAGKVVEELGLIVAMIVGLGVLGSAWALAAGRRHSPYLALGFAAFGWLVVVAVLLPICGTGLLGLNDGPTTPLVWAALFAVYSVVLQLGGSPSSIDSVDLSRRRLLSATPIAIGALSLGLLGFKLLPDWYRAIFNPPEAALRGPSPEITPVENFYVVSKNVTDPSIAEQGWTLGVGGMVDRPMRLSLSDLRAMTATKEYVTMECISNNVGGELMSTGRFTGVALGDLVAMASPR